MTQFGMVENGYITPEAQAEYLARHGHLELIRHMGATQERYFTFSGQGFKVVCVSGKVAQVIKMSEKDVKMIARCENIKFGGF